MTPTEFNFEALSQDDQYDLLERVWVEAAEQHGLAANAAYAFRAADGEVNLFGIRGLDAGRVIVNTNRYFNDTICVVWRSGGQKRVDVFEASTEYRGGNALLIEGLHPYTLGYHPKSRNPVHGRLTRNATWGTIEGKHYRALRPAPGVNPNFVRDRGGGNLLQDANEATGYNGTLNIHYGRTSDEVNTATTEGCQVLRGLPNYLRFIERVESDHSIRGTSANELASVPARDGSRNVIYALVLASTVEEVWRDGSFASGSASTLAASLPLDIGDGIALSEATAEAAFDHVEHGWRGGWYPVGASTLWHGGIHLHPAEATPRTVHACLPGHVVAARLGAGEQAEGPYGSRNFVLVRHARTAPAADGAAPPEGEPPASAAEAFFSLYMHLAPLADDGSGAASTAPPPQPTTTTGVNYRSEPVGGAASRIGAAPQGTRIERLLEAPEAARNTADFAWSRVHLAGGPVDAFVTTKPDLVAAERLGALSVERVGWLHTPAPDEMEITGDRYVRSAPVQTEASKMLGGATVGAGTRFVPRPEAPEAARQANRYVWGTVYLPARLAATTGRTQVDGFVHDGKLQRTSVPAELDQDLIDRLSAGDVVALDRAVGAGDVLWEVGLYGLAGGDGRGLAETLHWETFCETNMLADLCRAAPIAGAPTDGAPGGDGQAGPPPTPRAAPAPYTGSVRVSAVEGPATLNAGQSGTFTASNFNIAPSPTDRTRIRWEVWAGGELADALGGVRGDTIAYAPPLALAGQTVEVRAFMKSSTSDAAARVRVAEPPPWWAVEDGQDDFTVDSETVLAAFDGFDAPLGEGDVLDERLLVVVESRQMAGPLPDSARDYERAPALETDSGATEPAGLLAPDELSLFYAADPGGRATAMRHAVCRFVSEWGIPDVAAAVDALGVSAPGEVTAAVERHQWWAEARAAGVELPAEPRLWHYHPLSLVLHVAEPGPDAPTAASDVDGYRFPQSGGAVAVLSREAVELVIGHEVQSRDGYNEQPLWPGGRNSGVTIGIGYDLGQQSNRQIQADWGSSLSAGDVALLQGVSDHRGSSSRAAAAAIQSVRIPYDTAHHVLMDIVLARYVSETYSAFPRMVETHPHSQGALVSLVYNRGGGMTDSTKEDAVEESRREMRGVRDSIAAGRFAEVPGHIRAMKRVWAGQNLGGLITRREDEALLFERGLSASAGR